MADDRRFGLNPAGAVLKAGARLLAVFTLAAAGFAVADRDADDAEALFHFAHITEVMWGYGGDPDVQFIEIRQDAGGQNLTTNSVLGAFDATGAYMGDILVVPGDVPQSAALTRWTMGTPDFQVASGTTANFTFAPFVLPATGMICWGGGGGVLPIPPGTWPVGEGWDRETMTNWVDCVPYGGYTGPPIKNGPAETLGLGDGMFQSLNRITFTDVTVNDFELTTTCPTPQKGTGLIGFNNDNHTDLPPTKAYDDFTGPNSDLIGNDCGDTDDDNDGLTDATETGLPGVACPPATGPTNPIVKDTDGDRVLDNAECTLGSDPTNMASVPAIAMCQASGDADADGVFDTREFCYYGTSNASTNTDGEGMDDSCEIASINQDQTVNVIDLQQVAQHTATGGQGYLVHFDLNKDGVVNVLDLSFSAARSIPCP